MRSQSKRALSVASIFLLGAVLLACTANIDPVSFFDAKKSESQSFIDEQLFVGQTIQDSTEEQSSGGQELVEVEQGLAFESTPFEVTEELPLMLYERLNPVSSGSTLPPGFSDEVLGVAVIGSAAIYVGNSVVGLAWKPGPALGAQGVVRELKNKGWCRLGASSEGQGPLLNSFGGTYIKDTGNYRWLYLSFAEHAGSLSAVFNYSSAGGLE